MKEVIETRGILSRGGPSQRMPISGELLHLLKLYEAQKRYPDYYRSLVEMARKASQGIASSTLATHQKSDVVATADNSKSQTNSASYCAFFTKAFIGVVVAVSAVAIATTNYTQ